MAIVDGFAAGAMYTFNLTEHAVWVTIYDVAKLQHLDYGYMQPASAGDLPSSLIFRWTDPNAEKPPWSVREWASSTYVPPGVYHARAEVKDGNNNTIFDTEIELSPYPIYFAYLTGDASSYYWVQGVPPPASLPF